MSNSVRNFKGGQTMFAVLNNDGSGGGLVTQYSPPFGGAKGNTLSMHLDWTETSATYATTITLWGTNKQNPDESTDDDWVNLVAGHGWNGFTGGDPAGGDGKDIATIGNDGVGHFRLKFVRSTGAGTIDMFLAIKDTN